MSKQPGLAIHKNESESKGPTVIIPLAPARSTPVFDAYWKFAQKRQEIFFGRIEGKPSPWTDDPILQQYKFTNAYRASDRVSQYLIRHVIYTGDTSLEEVFFRILLFKFFNRISTWEQLLNRIGDIKYSSFNYNQYDEALTDMLITGQRIFSGAYLMPAGDGELAYNRKHRSYLRLLIRIMEDEVPVQMTRLSKMRDAFLLLRSYPMLGDFLAYQYVIDLNYSEVVNFSESEFIIPGPGAKSGMRKCFSSFGGLSEMDLIELVTERQEEEFTKRDINFRSLWGRKLQLIDCQNIFCEIDKYARIAFPEYKGIGDRIRIKQVYRMTPGQVNYWYPPKWGINHLIPLMIAQHQVGSV